MTRRASGGERSVEIMPSSAAAEVGAEHHAERHGKREHLQAGEGGEQKHDGEARIAEDGQERRDQHVEQHVAGQRREDHLHAGGLDDGLGRDRDPLQREHDESEPDQDASEAPDLRVLARKEQADADEDEQRREPRKIERQDDGHQRGSDVGAEHQRKRLRGADQALARERGDDQRGRGAALDERSHAQPRHERRAAMGYAAPQDAAQVAAVEAQDAGAHDVRAPHQQ